jgi:thioredoxin reductase (NADPH)
MKHSFDTCILGGGPAGLSAAIYLSRFNRSVCVIDRGSGRWSSHELNENYLGFPQGIHSAQLREHGVQQAQRFGAEIITDEVVDVNTNEAGFLVQTPSHSFQARSIIFASGVMDIKPAVTHFEDYWGRSAFWCITCDGYKSRDKKVVVIGNNDEAACTCLQFLNYTHQLSIITNVEKGRDQFSPIWKERFARNNVEVIEGCLTSIEGHSGMIHHAVVDEQLKVPVDYLFTHLGAAPNSQLASKLGVSTNPEGYILADVEQRTNIPFVYAAGDITKMFAHQIITAAHEGSMAAQACNYDLYDPDQRL